MTQTQTPPAADRYGQRNHLQQRSDELVGDAIVQCTESAAAHIEEVAQAGKNIAEGFAQECAAFAANLRTAGKLQADYAANFLTRIKEGMAALDDIQKSFGSLLEATGPHVVRAPAEPPPTVPTDLPGAIEEILRAKPK